MNTIYVLPKDLNDALKNLENSIISSLKLSSFRFTVEFTREPDIQLGFVYHFLTMGMILSLPMFLAGTLILVIKSIKNDTR